MHANRLHKALQRLSESLREVEAALQETRTERDPLAMHIFVSRRHHRNIPDTKSGKRAELASRVSWQTALTLGFQGTLREWGRLMGAG